MVLMLAAVSPTLAHAAGPLLAYLDDPTVLELRVTSAGRVFLVRFGVPKQEMPSCPAQVVADFLALAAHLVDDTWTRERPLLHVGDPRLGLRIQAGGPPVSRAPWLVCRKHPQQVFTLDDFDAQGILAPVEAELVDRQVSWQGSIRTTLEWAVRHRFTVMISGAVGSAKTSMLNAILATLAQSEWRAVILEDDQELQCPMADVEFLRTSEYPPITMRDLGKVLLRLSPDLTVIGEVRDGAMHDMLKAFQTGVAGLCTVHAPSAEETLHRCEQLISEVSYDPQRHLIGEAVDVICHMTQWRRSWRVTGLLAVDGWDGERYRVRDLLRKEAQDVA